MAFEKPVAVDDMTMSFGGEPDNLAPKYADIPVEFQRGKTTWNQFQRTWFFHGIKKLTIVPKEGIEVRSALRHLSAIQASFSFKHEHKEAAIAFLASQWFKEWKGQPGDSK